MKAQEYLNKDIEMLQITFSKLNKKVMHLKYLSYKKKKLMFNFIKIANIVINCNNSKTLFISKNYNHIL